MNETRPASLAMTLIGALAILKTIGIRAAIVLGALCLIGVLSPVFALASMLLIPALGSSVALAGYRAAIRRSPGEEIDLRVRIERSGLIYFPSEEDAGT